MARWLAVSLLLAASSAWAAKSVDVEGLRVWRAPDHTRLVFDLSGPVEHKLFSLQGPDRLVIDISKTRLRAKLSDLALADTPIRKVRSATRNKSDLRVVLDLSRGIKPRSFILPKQGGKRDRLVVDLYDSAKPASVKTSVTHAKDKRRNIVIAVDAGHGGEDPGASGAKRTREKDIVLKISKKLVQLIDSEPGFSAYLVRRGDYYVSLKKRPQLARKQRADLFISIHADAFSSPKAHGASVFALSSRGAKATSDSARYLAKQENAADLIGGVGSVSLDDKSALLVDVLVDLSMTASLDSSLKAGAEILKDMGKVAKLHKKRVEQANFAVLRTPDMPSVLVETGFISNPGEERKLRTASYRGKLATAIFNGARRYFYRYPPENSYVAWKKAGGDKLAGSSNRASSAKRASSKVGKTRQYTIARGDTLSAIALRYRTSVAALRSLNGLSGSSIRIGQKLTVPAS